MFINLNYYDFTMSDFTITDFYEYVKEILVVAIPAIIGALASKGIVNSWQTNAEKFKLRKQILSDYQKSFVRQHSEMANFVNFIYGNYITELKWDKTKENTAKNIISFPSNKAEQPFEKFSEEYKQYKKIITDGHTDTWNFFATVQLYHEDDDLEIKLEELSKQRSLCEISVEVFIRSNTSDEFKENYTKSITEFAKLRSSLHVFRESLIDSKIRKPDEHWIKSIFRKKYSD